MATSGSFYQQFHANLPWYLLVVDWSQIKDITNNRSTVTFNVYVESTTSGYSIVSSSRPVNYTVNGTSGTFNGNAVNNGGGSKTLLGTVTMTLPHNSDGSKSFTASFSWSFNGTIRGTYVGTVTASSTIVLDDIPRASSVTLDRNDVWMGEKIKITISRAVSSFTHTIRYGFGSASGTIASNVSTSYEWTVPLNLANQIPNTVQGWGRIHVDTYNGNTFIGTTSVVFYASVPTNIVPIVNTLNVIETNTRLSGIGAYVQKLSKLRITMTGQGAYGSTISKSTITVDNVTYNGYDVTINPIDKSGQITIVGTVTDSRGRTASKTLTINLVEYNYPKISVARLKRVDSLGDNDLLGSYVKIDFQGSFSPVVVNGIQNNRANWYIWRRERGASGWGNAILSGQITSGGIVSPSIPIQSGYSPEKSYEFWLEIRDSFNNYVYSIQILSSGETTLSLARLGVGIGKIWEQGAIDLKNDEIYVGGVKLIEQGSNSSGSYLKFSDGTLICYYQNAFFNVPTNNPYGALYYASSSYFPLGAYPHKFVERPLTYFFGYSTTSQTVWFTHASDYTGVTTWPGINAFSPVSMTTGYMVQCLAIGRWK